MKKRFLSPKTFYWKEAIFPFTTLANLAFVHQLPKQIAVLCWPYTMFLQSYGNRIYSLLVLNLLIKNSCILYTYDLNYRISNHLNITVNLIIELKWLIVEIFSYWS